MRFPMEFHHIGVLTRDMECSLRLYVTNFHYVVEFPAVELPGPGIRACSLVRSGSPRIELIEPLEPESTLGRMASRAATGYHLAWMVPDLEAAGESLEAEGFHSLPAFRSTLWNGCRCGFSACPGNTLIEFVEFPNPIPNPI